jgi:hypothetical protein
VMMTGMMVVMTTMGMMMARRGRRVRWCIP